MGKWDRRQFELHQRLQGLYGRLTDLESRLEAPVSADAEDRATEREDDEVMEAMGRGGVHEVARIHAALDRIAAGEYGICLKCGAEISEARLDLLPETPFCRHCAV